MTFGPPSDPAAQGGVRPEDAHPQGTNSQGAFPQAVNPQGMYSQGVPPPGMYPSAPPQQSVYPPQPWGAPNAPGWPGGPAASQPAGGPWPGAIAVVLAVLGCTVPLLPVDMTNFRGFVPLPFGLAGLALGILGCTGNRRGKVLAAIGVVLSMLPLLMSAVMLVL